MLLQVCETPVNTDLNKLVRVFFIQQSVWRDVAAGFGSAAQ
jgi:hypothetical protein